MQSDAADTGATQLTKMPHSHMVRAALNPPVWVNRMPSMPPVRQRAENGQCRCSVTEFEHQDTSASSSLFLRSLQPRPKTCHASSGFPGTIFLSPSSSSSCNAHSGGIDEPSNSAYEIHTLWWPLRPIRCSYSMCAFSQLPCSSNSGIASADRDTPSSNMASAHEMSPRSVIHLVEIVRSYWNTVINMTSGWKQQILRTSMYFLYSVRTRSNSCSCESVRSKIVDSDGRASMSTWM